MTRTVLRGRVLTFVDEPDHVDDAGSYAYFEDAAVLIGADGRIEDVMDFAQADVAGATVIDHRPHLIVPGFIDAHIHYVQSQMIASYAGQLLEWLNGYTFPAELKFGEQGHAEAIAPRFFDELIRNGTTTAAAYCSVHPQSVAAFFAEAQRRNMLMIGGKVMMDRHAPDGLLDTAKRGYDESKALIERWHGQGRGQYAISPRFAITSTPAQMEASKALAGEFPDLHIQTHLSENLAEVEYAVSLYPGQSDYLGIYDHYGLLGRKTLLGHSIHVSHRETALMAETGAVAVFCPTSNLFLGSGLFDHDRLAAAGVRIAAATDVGGGTSYSMLRTLGEGYKVMALRGQRLNPLLAFYRAGLGNARALSIDSEVGSVAPGRMADLIVLDASATPAMALRMEAASSLAEELFVLMILGDDRAVAETYVAGVAQKSGLTG